MSVSRIAILILLATSSAVFAQAPDDSLLSKGQGLAEANCAICHAIYATGNSPLVIAPTFRDIAVNYDFADLEDAFNEGVATEHPAMPDWQMTPEQAEAIAAYIMSLAHAGKQKTDLETPLQPLAGSP
jgi:mono/diheme cytochrome c family protein